MATKTTSGPWLKRKTFRTSRLLDFCSEKELIAQTGHRPEAWPLVVVKELMDNALDACEEVREEDRVAPEIEIRVDDDGITVADNGPGIPPKTVADLLDFSIRVSSREAYVALDRGAQGNALKTILAMPYVLSGCKQGKVEIAARRKRHEINFGVDHLREKPDIKRVVHPADDVRTGTAIKVFWPECASTLLVDAKDDFLQIADDFTWLNPHLTLALDWHGERSTIGATAEAWPKWRPSYPTCPHWYDHQRLERRIAAEITANDKGGDRTVREFMSEFRGISSTLKQKAVLESTGFSRTTLSNLCDGNKLDSALVETLLDAMKATTTPVKPAALGFIGRDHFERRFGSIGCEMESFKYKKIIGFNDDNLPFVMETAFAWSPNISRRFVTGVNWSPGIINPFRDLGRFGQSLDTFMSQQRVDRDEPIILIVHVAFPRVEYTDRGKSAVVI